MAAKKRRKSKAKSRRKTKAKSRRKTKATRKSKSKSKSRSKSKGKRKPFGGYAIKFAGRSETVEQVFGKKPVTPSEMTKKIWAFVKSKRLASR